VNCRFPAVTYFGTRVSNCNGPSSRQNSSQSFWKNPRRSRREFVGPGRWSNPYLGGEIVTPQQIVHVKDSGEAGPIHAWRQRRSRRGISPRRIESREISRSVKSEAQGPPSNHLASFLRLAGLALEIQPLCVPERGNT
jgi:hypothetical protein